MQHVATKRAEFLNQFEAILEYAIMGILITDSSGKIKAINPFALKEFGYTQKELLGAKIGSLIPSYVVNEHTPRQEKYSKFPQSWSSGQRINLFALKKDGTEFPVELSFGKYQYNGDECIITFINNVSARKNTEAKIERLNDDLEQKVKQRTETLSDTVAKLEMREKETREAEEEIRNVQHLFLQLLRNYPDGAISIIDKNYNFVYTGGELHSRMNSPLEQLMGNKIYPNFPETLRKVIKQALSGVFENKAVVCDFELPYSVGGHFFVMDAFPLIEEDGSINKSGVIIRNISELKKTEENLKIALQKEKDLNDLKSKFVSMASHEFRTPLSTVLSSAYLIEKYASAEEQPKREKHLQRIISSVNMLTDILNDFLSVGKIEEGKIQVRLTGFDIQNFIIGMAGELKGTLKKNQKLHCFHEGDPEVLMDASLLRHIVMNLVSNASKFSPETRPIEIRTFNRDDSVMLSVKDYGIGISKEDQQHLMERFFRGANAGNVQGTGLGLHIVSKYAELMNGKVEYMSELEKGTEFLITFNTKTRGYEEDITD